MIGYNATFIFGLWLKYDLCPFILKGLGTSAVVRQKWHISNSIHNWTTSVTYISFFFSLFEFNFVCVTVWICRWVKFEEKVEEGGERWSKPHVSTLSLHSLFELRTCLQTGTVLLDLEGYSLPQIVGKQWGFLFWVLFIWWGTTDVIWII